MYLTELLLHTVTEVLSRAFRFTYGVTVTYLARASYQLGTPYNTI